ncbi:DUF6901 family protein [Desulfurivibrio sp. D14AmB]|uniref:DUF6901 family protein n=1 Tax=Desulfurivibrio sp. D14AmB TaxID=3374370 RepID=UPI00376ED63A
MTTTSQFQISYRFTLTGSAPVVLDLRFDARTITLLRDDLPPPAWTRLTQDRCPNCPLDPDQTVHCPAALALMPLVAQFEHLFSHDQVFLEVITGERTISGQTTIQRAVSSLMGLLLAGSNCPHTLFFKPMARFHLPLASEEETIYRAASTYLLTQYFQQLQGREPDLSLEGLNRIYQNIQEVNRAMAQRLRHASRTDSSVNAIVLLDMYAKAMPYAIKQSLDEIAYLFEPG